LRSSGVEGAQQLAEHGIDEFLILALGQHAAQVLVIGLDGFHGVDDGLGAVGAVGQGHQGVELGLGLQEDGTLLRKILLGQRPRLAAASGQPRFDGILDAQKTAVGMPQEDQAHDRQEIFVACIVGICTQGFRRAPEPLFNGFDVFKLSQPASPAVVYFVFRTSRLYWNFIRCIPQIRILMSYSCIFRVKNGLMNILWCFDGAKIFIAHNFLTSRKRFIKKG